MPECAVMTFYLPNPDVRPVGSEAAEFIDLPVSEEIPFRSPSGGAAAIASPLPASPKKGLAQAITDVIIRAAGRTR
jgi:hypothetical protein